MFLSGHTAKGAGASPGEDTHVGPGTGKALAVFNQQSFAPVTLLSVQSAQPAVVAQRAQHARASATTTGLA